MKFNLACITLLLLVVASANTDASMRRSSSSLELTIPSGPKQGGLVRSKTRKHPVQAYRSRSNSESSISVLLPNAHSFTTYPQSDLDGVEGELSAVKMMPNNTPLATGQLCEAHPTAAAKHLSLAGQFKNGLYKAAQITFVKIPSGIARFAGKIAHALQFPWRCGLKGFVMDLVDYFLGDHGYAQAPSGKSALQKAGGIVTAPIMLASLPFMLAGWVFGAIAEKADQKFPEKPAPGAMQSIPMLTETPHPSMEQVNAFAEAIQTELAPVFESQEGHSVEQAIHGIGGQLADRDVLNSAMMRAAERVHRESGMDLTNATRDMLRTRRSEVSEVVNVAVQQELSMLHQ